MIDTSKYEGHTPAPWETNSEDSQGVWQEHDENIPRHIAMVHSEQNWEDMTEAEFTRMMADKQLIADAPLLLDFIVWVKNTHPHYYHRLTEAYETAKKNNR